MTDACKLQFAVFPASSIFHGKFTQTPFQDAKYTGLHNCATVPPPPPHLLPWIFNMYIHDYLISYLQA